MRLYSNFIIHLKNDNNNNLFCPAPPVIDLAHPQHLHSKFSGAAPGPEHLGPGPKFEVLAPHPKPSTSATSKAVLAALIHLFFEASFCT